MTDQTTQPLTEQQLTEIERFLNGPLGPSSVVDPETARKLVAEIRRLRARLWELERPSTDAERAALRQSFMELAAQAREDRDYEGAFDLECQLREREEQWKREDAAAPAVAAAGDAGSRT